MSELDVIKERLTYLRLWIGILVVTDISLFGWAVTNAGSAPARLVIASAVAIVAVTIGWLHRRMGRHIKTLRDL